MKSIITFVNVFIFLLLPSLLPAAGSLFGTGTCPVPPITGFTDTLAFNLQGPTPPSNAEVTVVTGSCSVDGAFPSTATLTAGETTVSVGYSYYSNSFQGISPESTFVLAMRFSGDYGEPTEATGGTCTINVSWDFPRPASTPITGPNEVSVHQSIVLDGEITHATSYSWSASGDCLLEGPIDQSTVIVRGTDEGSCEISREACDSEYYCVTNTHSITVGATLLTPIYLLLLL
jgi:hypothetical protein